MGLYSHFTLYLLVDFPYTFGVFILIEYKTYTQQCIAVTRQLVFTD